MSDEQTISASYFDGRTPRRHAVRLRVLDHQLIASGEYCDLRIPLDQLQVSEPMGSAPRTLRTQGEDFFEVSDLAGFDVWLKNAGFPESTVVRLQKRWSWTLLALLASALLVFAGYRWGLPVLGEQLANRLPAGVAVQISDHTLSVLDQKILRPSRLTGDRQRELLAHIEQTLVRGGGLPSYRIDFRASSMGPNAFALPDGHVIILDSLVELAEGDDEVTAVVAHELGHVAHRHGMRQLIQSSIVSFVVATYLGDISSLISGFAALALESNYSRDFEREADDYAVDKLRNGGTDPLALAIMLERLENLAQGKGRSGEGWSALSSHPETAERIRRIRSGI